MVLLVTAGDSAGDPSEKSPGGSGGLGDALLRPIAGVGEPTGTGP